MNVLDHLVEEHRNVEAMLSELAQSLPGDDRARTVRELEAALDTHMAVEERFVYPLLRAHIGVEAFDGAENEHELARGELFQVISLVARPGFGAAVEALHAGLQHHVAEEEQEIFPILRERAAIEIEELGDPQDLEVRATDREIHEDVDEGQSSSEMTPEELRVAIAQYEASHRT